MRFSAWLSSGDHSWEAGILPLNYAREWQESRFQAHCRWFSQMVKRLSIRLMAFHYSKQPPNSGSPTHKRMDCAGLLAQRAILHLLFGDPPFETGQRSSASASLSAFNSGVILGTLSSFGTISPATQRLKLGAQRDGIP